MSAQPKMALTEEGYLARERVAEIKSEFYDGQMVAMVGRRGRTTWSGSTSVVPFGVSFLRVAGGIRAT